MTSHLSSCSTVDTTGSVTSAILPTTTLSPYITLLKSGGTKSKKGSDKNDKGYEVSRRMEGGIVVSRIAGKKIIIGSG